MQIFHLFFRKFKRGNGTDKDLIGSYLAEHLWRRAHKDQPVNVFKNAASGEINVVYRRTDGNIGWVDPSSGK